METALSNRGLAIAIRAVLARDERGAHDPYEEDPSVIIDVR